MAKAKNTVISGDYKGGKLKKNIGAILMTVPLHFGIIEISKKTVESIEIIDNSSSRSTSSTIVRGVVGGMIGSVPGAVIGGMTGKKNDIYHVLVRFKDGKQSLLELDNDMYNKLLKVVF